MGNKPCSNVCRPEDAESDEEVEEGGLSSIPHTTIPSEYFATPVPVTMSGGTAQFFHLQYTGPTSGPVAQKYGKSATYWLGKDVERALDELPFYEDLLKLDLNRYALLRDWTMTYAGILNAQVAESADDPSVVEDEPRNLLVIHDISDGLDEKRMLDIKIGKETAVAGWRGKSARAAAGNRAVDYVTNSVIEGYRLEGFDNQPSSLSSQHRGDTGGLITKCRMINKKSNRLQLQMLPFRDFCRYWDDFTDLEDFYVDTSLLSVAENSEAIMFDAVRQLAQLCSDALAMPAPQMWIGSSLCLACDSGRLLNRRQTLERLARPRPPGAAMQTEDIAKVCVFDWGRSELNTMERQQARTQKEQQQRATYWNEWCSGVVRAFFEATCLYTSQFWFEPEVFIIEAWDFDSFDPNDLLGSVTIPARPTDGPEEFEITGGWRRGGSVTVDIAEMPLPAQSRLQKMWRVYVYSVEGLPRADVLTDTDPLIRVKLGKENGSTARYDTPVVWDDRNAEIEHPLYFGLAKRETIDPLMQGISSLYGAALDPSAFQFGPSEDDEDDARDKRFKAFLDTVPRFAPLRTIKK